jgi:hypothetical protein
MDALSKPVLDRIRRYAQEGREPCARYGRDGCLLLAVATGRIPVVIFRCAQDQFAELRSAAMIAWNYSSRSAAIGSMRAARRAGM